MPPHIEPMLATLASKPFSDPDWLFEIKWDGYRVQAVVDGGKVKIWTRNLQRRRDLLPAAPDAAVVDRCQRGDRRWRGRRARRRRPARLRAAPDERLGEKGVAGPRLPGVRPALPRRPVAAGRPARGPQAPAQERAQGAPAGPLRGPRRRRGPGVLRGGARPAASRASSPSSAARATSRAAGRRPGSSSRSGPSRSSWSAAGRRARATRATSARWPSASTRTASCGSPARSAPGSTARRARQLLREARAARDRRPAVRPAAAAATTAAAGAATCANVRWVRPELVIRAEFGGWSRDGIVRQAAFKGLEDGPRPDRRSTARRAVATTTARP